MVRIWRWYAEVGADPDLAVAQIVQLRRQIPLMYGLLLINSAAVAVTHIRDAPPLLTLSIPLALFITSMLRVTYWLRKRRTPSPEEARRQLQNLLVFAGTMTMAYGAWASLLLPYGGTTARYNEALYVSSTVIGCVFCYIHLPQAAVLVALTIAPSFVAAFARLGPEASWSVPVIFMLVLGVLVRVMFVAFSSFREQVRSQSLLTQLADDSQKLALTDSLTGLPNRRRFYADLDEMLSLPERDQCLAVGLLDLDRFKPVNDLYGHAVGDRLLKAVAQRLQHVAGPFATIYRLGGDEFGVLIYADAGETTAVGERMCQSLESPIEFDDLRIAIGASVGVVNYGEAGTSADTLVDRADYALYCAKRGRTGGQIVFTPALETEIRADRVIEAALHTADLEDEIDVLLQPIIDTQSGKVVAAEILARWESPTLGAVEPKLFIPLAERSGAIHRITLCVVQKALRIAARLPDELALSINISVCDLQSPSTMTRIIAMIRESDVAPQRLWIEVTETAVMQNVAVVCEALHEIQETGAKVALDDFGTGYSSLSNLHVLPFDKIKIDRSFMAELDSGYGRSIAQAIIGLCQKLEIPCVAEGVETEAQLSRLVAMGCGLVQGFLFSQPVDEATFNDVVFRRSQEDTYSKRAVARAA